MHDKHPFPLVSPRSGTLFLRPFDAADAEGLFQLHTRTYRTLVEASYGPWDEPEQRTLFSKVVTTYPTYVLKYDSRILGFVCLADLVDGDIWVELLEIDPPHQGYGWGTALLKWVHSQAQQRCGGVRLQVHLDNRRALALYVRLGYQVIDTTPTHRLLRLNHIEANR